MNMYAYRITHTDVQFKIRKINVNTGAVIGESPVDMTVSETPIKGKISIIKHSDDGTTGIETPEVGAEFDIYLKSAGSFENAKDSERDHLICDENGFAQTKMLPYGVYVVHQTVGWDNTEWVDDFEVNVCENEEDYFYIINDAVLTSYVKIVKKDAETGNIIPLAGIGFKVWDCASECYVVQNVNYPTPTDIDTFYTDETGTLMLPNELVYGNYELHEVQSANGYVLDSTPVPFTIDGTVDIVVVEKTNKPQKGKISVSKTGDVFTNVTMASSSYTDEDGNFVENPTIYTPVFEKAGLAGAVFEVTAAEDIVTADGTIRAKKGDVVATLTTDENEAITVEISKLDITNDEELVGSTLQIIDEDGVVVEEWVSYEHPHFIEAQLIAGKTYTLKETISPDGYTIANSIDFTVNEDGTGTAGNLSRCHRLVLNSQHKHQLPDYAGRGQ